MKKIETESRYDYNKLFDAVIDRNKLRSETVGKDADGQTILHICETVSNSSAYGTVDEYFVLTAAEFVEYVVKARENKLITRREMKKLIAAYTAPRPKGKISSFQSVLLRTSGMRGTVEQEIRNKDGSAEVSQYAIRYNGGDNERVLQKRAVCPVTDVLRLLNDCSVLSWNGFNGPHPKGVLDGIMFVFDATVNDGQTIHARGSQNFPRHYRDFTDGLYEFLKDE